MSAKVAPVDGDEEPRWTVEELKAAKPQMVYFYVDGLTQQSGDDSYKFASSWEQGCLVDKVIEQINTAWVARKVGLDINLDRKLEKNQARIEFWSFTNVKMGTVNVTERSQLNPSPFKALLKKYEAKNTEVCAKEIKKLEAIRKAAEKREAALPKDETASK